MPTRALARFAGLTFSLALTASLAQAQPRTIIAVDPADKAASFGAADLSDAIARWRGPVTVIAPAQLAREAAPNVVVVTIEAAKQSPKKSRVPRNLPLRWNGTLVW